MVPRNIAAPLSTPLVIIPSRPGISEAPLDTHGSYFSSREGASNNSSEEYGHPSPESSRYLTPPLSRGDYDIPPYKARSESSGSLNMTERNADILSQAKPARGSKKNLSRSGNQRDRKNAYEQQIKLSCSTPGGKVVPGASTEPNNSWDDHKNLKNTEVSAKHTQANRDSREGRLLRKTSAPAPMITSRRWSSVGVDSLHNPACLRRIEPTEGGHCCGQLNRNGTWGLGLREEKFIQAVRSRLTGREVSTKKIETPATITLRRASGTIKMASGNFTPKALPNVEVKQQLSTYLITSSDVDSIIDLIQLSIKSSRQKKPPIMSDLRVEYNLPENGNRRLSVTAGGVLPRPSVPANPATTVAGIMRTPESPHISRDSQCSGLGEGKSIMVSKALPKRSVYEVIWEGNISSQRSSRVSRTPLPDSEIPELNNKSTFTDSIDRIAAINVQETPFPKDSDQVHHSKEPSQPWSIFRPVWNTPLCKATSDMALAGPRSSFIQVAGTQTSTGESDPLGSNIPDVFSFPPLPLRKLTSDWISPLPDINTHLSPMFQITESSHQPEDRSLYDSGIDARTGHSPSALVTPNYEIHSPNVNSPDSSGSLTPYQSSAPNTPRRSIVLPQSQAIPRIGSLHTLGHAIGVSSGARRKSSTQSNHIRIDNALPGCYRESKPWIKPRKDSGWPLQKSPSPEPETGKPNTREGSQIPQLASKKLIMTIDRTSAEMDGNRNRSEKRGQDRTRLLEAMEPPMLKPDHAGIYAILTGSRPTREKVIEELGQDCCAVHNHRSIIRSREPSVDWIG